MKTLKLTLAVTFIAASAFAVATAAEALHSQHAAVNAPTATPPVAAGVQAATPAVGNPHGMSCMAGTHSSTTGTDATAHCKTPMKGQPRKSCCN